MSTAIPSADNLAAISGYIQHGIPAKKQRLGGLATAYDLLPFKRRHEVVDFWSQLFLGNEKTHAAFSTQVVSRLQSLGYVPKRNTGFSAVSFGEGMVGPARQMVSAHAGRSQTTVFFASVGDFLYVSLRTIYRPNFSLIRLGFHVLVILVLALLAALAMTESYCANHYYYSWNTYYSGCTDSQYEAYAVEQLTQALIGFGISLTLLRFILSFWRTHNLWTWLYEDFNELYRDDVSLLGGMTHLCIVSVADELDLQRVQVSQAEPPPPQFGATAQTASSRKRRI